MAIGSAGLASANYMLAFGTLFSANEQAKGERLQGDFERNQFLRNAEFADIQAKDATSRGALAASRQRAEIGKVVGGQRAAFAANGIDAASRSVSDVAADTTLKGELDAITIESNAFREAFGFRVEAAESRAAGEAARASSQVRAGNTLITGGLNAGQFIAKGFEFASKSNNGPSVKIGTGSSQLLESRPRTGNERFNTRRGF